MGTKVELVLSKTYMFKGKVFEKGTAYTVKNKDAQHLLAQRNERDIPYFRASDAAASFKPGLKRTDKGGKPIPANDNVVREEDKPVAANETQALDEAAEKAPAPKPAAKKKVAVKPKPDKVKKAVADDDADKVEI